VGAGLGGILLIALVAFLFYRFGKKRSSGSSSSEAYAKPELADTQWRGHEAQAADPRHELYAPAGVWEVTGSGHHSGEGPKSIRQTEPVELG
jgi:hypothetical protein